MLRGVGGCLSDQVVHRRLEGGGGVGHAFNDGKCRGRKLRSGFTKSIMHINKYALYNS